MADWTFEIDGQTYDIARLRKLIKLANAEPHRIHTIVDTAPSFIEVLVNRIEELEKDLQKSWARNSDLVRQLPDDD